VSCNSTFITLATQRLNGPRSHRRGLFGFNFQPSLGIPATLGRFTTPHTPVDLAGRRLRPGTDLVNPLSEASMAGAVETVPGARHKLSSAVPKQSADAAARSTVLATLRPMMRAVVTTGTAANVGFQAGVFGKTGTAEFGTSRTGSTRVRRYRGTWPSGAGRGRWRRRRRVGADREASCVTVIPRWSCGW